MMPPFRESVAPVAEQEPSAETLIKQVEGAETAESRAMLERAQRLNREAPQALNSTVERDHGEYSEKFGSLDNSVAEIQVQAQKCEGVLLDLEKSIHLVASESDRREIAMATEQARNAISNISAAYADYQESFTPTHPNFVAAEANLTRMVPFLETELQKLQSEQTSLEQGDLTDEAVEAEKNTTAIINAINLTTVKAKLVTPLEISDWGSDSAQAHIMERLSTASEEVIQALAQIQLALEGTHRIPQTLENRLIDLTEIKQIIDSESLYLKQKFALCRATREDMLGRYKRIQSSCQNLVG
ncbi:hypothetical protein KC571_01015 [candidate division WWE3 bacterium]|uniref:Uncharacterized protein n=1 Tax=candidate division WWE3 bacterium TaxID=2053526 RepID=A0A955LHR9_UNCKA|nr:hypothetical protein [candidate division WWE3 bacterium]